jgi:hypothetical protein
MSATIIVFALISTLVVFAIAAGVIGREAHRLDAVAPRVVYEIDQAVLFVSDALPEGTQSRLTSDEVRSLLLGHLNWMADRDLMPKDVVDRRQDIETPVVADETALAAYLLNEAVGRGVDLLDDVDVVFVLDAHNAYLAAIGAVGPKAESL